MVDDRLFMMSTFIQCWFSDWSLQLLMFDGCSSFVPLCVSQSMRYEENLFYGNRGRPWVEEGNMQQEVTAITIFFSFLLGCIPVLEQPTGSVLPKLPSLRNVFAYFDFTKTVTYMGSFAGPTMKPLQIWHRGFSHWCFGWVNPFSDGWENLFFRWL